MPRQRLNSLFGMRVSSSNLFRGFVVLGAPSNQSLARHQRANLSLGFNINHCLLSVVPLKCKQGKRKCHNTLPSALFEADWCFVQVIHSKLLLWLSFSTSVNWMRQDATEHSCLSGVVLVAKVWKAFSGSWFTTVYSRLSSDTSPFSVPGSQDSKVPFKDKCFSSSANFSSSSSSSPPLLLPYCCAVYSCSLKPHIKAPLSP